MTLWTLLGGFVPVAILFVGLDLVRWRGVRLVAVAWGIGEAALATMLGALWFGSLGKGGWLTLFLLVGLLVAWSERGTRVAFLRSAIRPELIGAALVVARYLLAGAVLAWRLA
jgi:hypothetical protein